MWACGEDRVLARLWGTCEGFVLVEGILERGDVRKGGRADDLGGLGAGVNP